MQPPCTIKEEALVVAECGSFGAENMNQGCDVSAFGMLATVRLL